MAGVDRSALPELADLLFNEAVSQRLGVHGQGLRTLELLYAAIVGHGLKHGQLRTLMGRDSDAATRGRMALGCRCGSGVREFQ